MKTRAISATEIDSHWVVMDATDRILGRLAGEAAVLLMGKHKAAYSPNIDNGDHVVIVNAARVRVTGRKLQQKIYYRHSGYPGGLRAEALGSMLKRKPTWVLEHAVRGMLPRTKLGDAMMSKLRVYAGAEHPHQGQVNPGSGEAKRTERRHAAPVTAGPAVAEQVAAEESEPQAT